MREPELKDVGPHTYEIRPLNTSVMVKTAAKLAKLMGPLATMLDQPAQLTEMANLGALLAQLVEHMDSPDVLAVMNTFAEHTTVVDGDRKVPLGGSKGCFEVHFQGDPVGLVRWLGAALEVSFGPLVEWLRTMAPAKPAALAPSR
jgi:hypothetical protein